MEKLSILVWCMMLLRIAIFSPTQFYTASRRWSIILSKSIGQ